MVIEPQEMDVISSVNSNLAGVVMGNLRSVRGSAVMVFNEVVSSAMMATLT